MPWSWQGHYGDIVETQDGYVGVYHGVIKKMIWAEHFDTVIYTVEKRWGQLKHIRQYEASELKPFKEMKKTAEEIRIDFPEGYGYAGIENKQVINKQFTNNNNNNKNNKI